MTDYERVEKVIGEWELQGGDAAALVAQRRWVCWKKKPKTGGGFTKPPIDPKTGLRIDIRTDAGRANLLPASTALSAYNTGKCDGIGLVTGEIDGVSLCGLDIDHCLTDDGKILDKFRDDLEVIGKHGYFEVSPSGHGVRGFTLCRKPNGYAVRRGGVEVYFDGQYMTLTGKRVKGADLPLCDDDTAVQHLCKKYLSQKTEFPQERARSTAAPQEQANRHWRDVIREALPHDSTLALLWEGRRPNGNESSDDQALMNKLAFYCSKDKHAMLEAFRSSPHAATKDKDHVKKMDRQDYLSRTADKAITGCSDTAEAKNERYHAERVQPESPTYHNADPGIAERMDRKKEKPKPKLLAFSSVAYEPPSWVIEPYVPRGKITIIQGDSGTGKTAFACALAARVSTNVPLLGREISAPGPVLMFSVEDDPSTLRGRIEASGGDVSRCFFPDVAAGLSFSDPCIEGLILECGAKLVVFDPLQAFLGGNVDMHRANETRPVLAGLADMAKRNDCAICIISHLNKSDTKGIYKALGSVDIIAASRSVLHIGRNPENDAQCAVIHLKSSNARNGSSFLYTIGDRGGVTFDEYCSLTYEDLQTAIKRKDTGSNYEQEPLVQVFRKFIADKPGGGFISYDEFRTFGAKLLGFPPFGSTTDFKNKLKNGFSRELQRNDGIIITPGAKQNGARGIRIECYSAPAEYQLNISTEGA